MNRYNTTLGARALIVTMFVSIVVFSLLSLFIHLFYSIHLTGSRILSGIIIVLICGIYVATMLYRPSSYSIDEKTFCIHRLAGTVEIPLDQIIDVRKLKKGTLGWMEKDGGNGGCFGIYGEFRTSFGKATFYATRLDKLIILFRNADSPIVVSPDDLAMLKILQENVSKKNS